MVTRFNINNEFEAQLVDGTFAPIFKDKVYIARMQYPIGGKNFRVVGLGGEVQDAFFKTFNNDMLLLNGEREVEKALQQVIITMGYRVGEYEIAQ